jgi:hypothetical protein
MSQPQSFPGPIKLSQDGRYFIDGRGLPFFWLGKLAGHSLRTIVPKMQNVGCLCCHNSR